MSTAPGIRADPFSESPTIHPEVRDASRIAANVGMNVEHYREWLSNNGQADTLSSRHRYLIDMDAAEVAARTGNGR
jgi:hypothetical protein